MTEAQWGGIIPTDEEIEKAAAEYFSEQAGVRFGIPFDSYLLGAVVWWRPVKRPKREAVTP